MNSIFCKTVYPKALGVLILTVGLVSSALAQLPSTPVGVNVEASNVCPSCTHYILTNHGDLFDLAAQAGWNTFRLTQYETWRSGEMDTPYTAQNWTDIYARAQATNIYLIVVVEGYAAAVEKAAITNAPADQKVAVRVSYDEPLIDSILQPLPVAQRSRVAIDLGNEEDENGDGYSRLAVYQQEAAYIRSQYPDVSITVGAWRVGNSWEKAPDGAIYQPLEDFISVHQYPPNFYSTEDSSANATSTAKILKYMEDINSWSNGKQILLEEYGSWNGTSPNATCATCSPQAQVATNAAFLEGVTEAQQEGINTAGGLVWSYYPRGTLGSPVWNLSGSDNRYVLLVPDGVGGPNLPITTLPAASILCPASMNCPAFPSSLVEAIFTRGYTHVVADTNNGKHLTMDGKFVWNPLSGNTVVSSSDLLTGINDGASLSCVISFPDGTSAHIVAELQSITAVTSGEGGAATGSESGYAHLTGDTSNGKHFTADGRLTWNTLSGNTVTTANDLVSGLQPGGNFSAIVTFEGGSSVHMTAQFGAVTVTLQ